jgi:hypothetical protein
MDCLGLACGASADHQFVKRKREEKMKVIALTALAAAAGLATANPIQAGQFAGNTVDTAGTPTSSITIDISGFQGFDAQGSALNDILSVFIGVGAEVTGIAWDVNLSTFGGSWASESVMNFGGQVFLTPGSADSFGVTNQNYNSGGVIDLSDNGIPNTLPDAGGNLEIEFFESFVDNAGAGDSIWEAGSTVTLVGTNIVPAPGALAMLGLGGLVAGRRRR